LTKSNLGRPILLLACVAHTAGPLEEEADLKRLLLYGAEYLKEKVEDSVQ
jgi:hypothetical protein